MPLNVEKETGLTFDDVLLVPQPGAISSRKDVYLSTVAAKDLFLQIPILSSPMDSVTEGQMAYAMKTLGGLGVIHRFMSMERRIEELAFAGRQTAAAIGLKDSLDDVEVLLYAGADALVLDIANAYIKRALIYVAQLKKAFPTTAVIAGNVATAEGALRLEDAGADGIKVGIGPGSICATRIVAGVGVPQLTAIADCADRVSVPIVADGGIKSSGDIVKALAAGASSVMLGRLLAGCNEAPGELVKGSDGKEYKRIRGMASDAVMQDHNKEGTPEGVSGLVPASGPVAGVIGTLLGGIRSGMVYVGAEDISQLQAWAKFIRITPNGLTESRPHDIIQL